MEINDVVNQNIKIDEQVVGLEGKKRDVFVDNHEIFNYHTFCFVQ